MSEFNHNGQQENLMQIFMSDHRELFGLVKRITTHHFLFVCIVICLLRYYVYIFYVNQNYFGLDLPTPGYQRKQLIPIPIHMRHLYYVRVGCCIGAMLTPGFFHFFSILLCKEQYRPFVPSFVSSYRSRWLGKSVSPSLVFFCATDSLQGCPVLYAFSC